MPFAIMMLGMCAYLQTGQAQAITPGQRIDKTPLYPDAQGGLSQAADLTNVLPQQPFGLDIQLKSAATSQCFAPGATDECAARQKTWLVSQVTYKDQPGAPIVLCVCGDSALSADDLASSFSIVSFLSAV